MARKELTNVTFVPNWLSAVGALAGALHVLAPDIPPPPSLTGLSGHAFQLTLPDGDGFARPSPPTRDSYSRTVSQYSALGIATRIMRVPPGDRPARDAAFAAIRRSIDRGRPAIAFGLHLPEFGLVRGYDDGRGQLLVSTLTTEQHGPVLPLALWPPPGSAVHAPVVLVERGERFRRREAETAALRFALNEADAAPGEGEAACGLAAYERWRAALLTAEERIEGRGHAYLIQSTLAARREAAQFLAGLFEDGWERGPLEAAAAEYRAETLALSRLASIFPYPHGGDIGNTRVREQAARYVELALAHERAALERIASAVR